jgi:DNA-binding MarR family transcriptional regulator
MGVNRLSNELRLEKSSASRMLDSLENKGYIKSKADPRDGRARLVEMTGRGRIIHDKIVAELVEEKREILTGVSKSTRTAAIRIIGELARIAEDRFGSAIGSCDSE